MGGYELEDDRGRTQPLRMPLNEFVALAERARARVPAGAVDWTSSELGWMRFNSPPTKNMLGRDIITNWLQGRNIPYEELGPQDNGHLKVAGARVAIHIGILGSDGSFQFSQLRGPGHDVEMMLLLGIEPQLVRIWRALPRDVVDLPTYREQIEGLHTATFPPDDPPAWLLEVARWEATPNDNGQLALGV